MDLHGGNIYAAARELHCSPSAILDFSASINPLGMSSKAVQAVHERLGLATHYPDPDCYELKKAIGLRFGIDPACVCIGNGSTELIYQAPKVLGLRRALIIGPTFSEYAAAMETAGGSYRRLLGTPEEGYRLRTDAVLAALEGGYDCVFLCNPNNPTGQVWRKAEVLEIWQKIHDLGISLIVDEAFIDYVETESILPDASSRPGLLVLRSFTKFYGMPGLRAGYLVGEPLVIRRNEAKRLPWSVNVLVQAAATASLEDQAYAFQSRKLVEEERPRLATALHKLGFAPSPSSANFLFVQMPVSLDSTAITLAARREGVLIRDCSSFEGIGQNWIRVAVRTAAEHERLLHALDQARTTVADMVWRVTP